MAIAKIRRRTTHGAQAVAALAKQTRNPKNPVRSTASSHQDHAARLPRHCSCPRHLRNPCKLRTRCNIRGTIMPPDTPSATASSRGHRAQALIPKLPHTVLRTAAVHVYTSYNDNILRACLQKNGPICGVTGWLNLGAPQFLTILALHIARSTVSQPVMSAIRIRYVLRRTCRDIALGTSGIPSEGWPCEARLVGRFGSVAPCSSQPSMRMRSGNALIRCNESSRKYTCKRCSPVPGLVRVRFSGSSTVSPEAMLKGQVS